jgi:uncharacterized MAPEG superfamily protein
LAAVLAVAVAASGLSVVTAPAVSAAPGATSRKLAEPRDDEGATKSLTDQLDDATRGFLEAKDNLAASKKNQAALTAKLKAMDSELVTRSAKLGEIARQSYRTGRLSPMTAILGAGSQDGFLDRAATLDLVAVKEDRALRELQETRAAQQQAKLAIDTEIRNQQKQLNQMGKRKVQAETALKAAQLSDDKPGTPASAGSGSSGRTVKAKAARRNSNGSLPGESCSVNDPTTSGCITPRTLNAMKQAKAAGFTRFVSCFRPQGSGEHPKGRACDFASDRSGFGGVASGSSRTYGDRLANYFINNADRLGVLYVIWFKRIWLPSSGWKSYSRGRGDPSSDHTNHVHLSMR